MSLADIYLDEPVEISVQPKDAYGEPDGDPTVSTVDAQIRRRQRLVRDFKGDEVMSTGSIIVESLPALDADINFDGATHRIVATSEARDFMPDHHEVFLV